MTDIIKTEGWDMVFIKINVRGRSRRRWNFETKINKGLIEFFGGVTSLLSKSDGEGNGMIAVEINKLGNDVRLTVDRGVVDGNNVGTK